MVQKENKVVDVQGLATTKFKEIKDAWKELAERAYEDSVGDIENELDNGIEMCDPFNLNQYADEAQTAQALYNIIDDCKDMEDYIIECEGIYSNLKKVLADMRITNRMALMEYAIDVVDIDEEIVNEMCKVFD